MLSSDIIASQAITKRKKADKRLIAGATKGSADEVARALESGASPNAHHAWNYSALTLAATGGFIEVVKLLIEAGANVNRRDIISDSDIQTALHAALDRADLQMADLLLSHGADPRIYNQAGASAAVTLIMSGAFRSDEPAETRDAALALLERMLETEGVVNLPDSDGDTPLSLALGQGNDLRLLDLVLCRGANPNAMFASGETAMHRTWPTRAFLQLHTLLEHGADVNSRDRYGASALSYAEESETVVELVRLGADIGHLDSLGRNALATIVDSRLAQGMRMEVSRCLIDLGIDTAHIDYTGASVESRLVDVDTPDSAALLALIAARKAKEAMTNVIQTARAKPR